MKRPGGAGTEEMIRKKAQKSKRSTTKPGDDSGKGLLPDTQKQILYTFDALGTYGEDLQLEVSPVEVEALLRQCSEMLRKLTKCKIPISVDTWTGLGKIRDGLVKLVEQKLGPGHNMSSTLKFDSLDQEEKGSLSHNMNIISQSVPRSLVEIAKSAIIIIQSILSAM